MAQILKIGDKIELCRPISKRNGKDSDLAVYISQILDFSEENEIIAAMPISEGHIVPLEVGTRMEAYFYTSQGIYRGDCTITKRGKEANVYMCAIMLEGQLSKFQRRQYYRLPSTLEATVNVLDILEIMLYSKEHEIPEELKNPAIKATIVDISGGGVRMMSDHRFNRGDYISLKFTINLSVGYRPVEIVGKVIQSTESTKRARFYDSRIQFKEIEPELREVIVKYIFEQQRMIQKKERG